MEKAGPARLLIRAVYVEAAVAAGTETQKCMLWQTLNINTLNKWIHNIHNAWCLENGYPLRPYVPGPGGPRSQALKHRCASVQAFSQGFKLQARSHKLQDPRTRVQATGPKLRGQATRTKVFFLCFIWEMHTGAGIGVQGYLLLL